VTLQENVPGRLRCASVGGYPPPELTMFVADRDVTSLFRQSTAATLHGSPGLRLMVHQTVLWTDRRRSLSTRCWDLVTEVSRLQCSRVFA